MASGWKSHRGRNSQSQSQSGGRPAMSSQADIMDRNEVPQRPPTVGQELPNNLIPSLQDWQLETRLKQPKNRKKGNLEKNKVRKSDVLASCNSAQFGPPIVQGPHLQMRGHSRPRMSDAESTSDGDANNQHIVSHGTRPKTEATKRLDTNQITGKLVQIRDYIKQVTSLIESLENVGDPSVVEKLEKLRKVRYDLLENEHSLVELLQRVSVLQNEPMHKDGSNSEVDSVVSARGNALANVDGTSEASDDEADDGEDEASDSYEKRNELLRKVAESQQKLKALQGQQAMLVSLQQQAESRLAQARTFHDHLTSKTNENEQAELTVDEYCASNVLQRDLLNIEQRLALLQDLHLNKEQDESPSRSVDGEELGPNRDDRVCEIQRRELQNKLQDLQQKKRHMDDLLSELSLLRETRAQDGLQMNGLAINGQSDKKHMVVTKDSVAAAQQSLKSVDTTDKMRKLEEMKTWLHNMEDIVYNYHAEQSGNENPAAAFQQLHGKLAESPFAEQAVLASGNVPPKHKKEKKMKTNNLCRELSNECIAKVPSHAMIPKTEHNHHSRESFVEEANEQDMEEKARKIHAAKTKLQKLQNLLTAVQQSQQSGEFISAELAEQLFNSINNDEGTAASNYANAGSSVESHESRLPTHQFATGAHQSAKVTPMHSIVNRSSQHQQPDRSWLEEMNDTAGERTRRKSNSTRESFGSATKLPTSNQELWLEMRHQMALQEELQQRRRELESLMQKDASKNYLLNQDNRSEQLSASAKSEPLLVAASVGGTDVTSAATWGGSSIDNGVRENDSQEGQNERIDDEEYSSDEAVEHPNPSTVSLAAHESCLSKTKNCATSGSHGETEANFGLQELHRPSTGIISGDAPHPPVLNSVPTNHAKVAWQQPERGHAQELTNNTHSHDEHSGHDPTSLPFTLNLPVQANMPPQVQQQMETATLLCQTILRDQHILSGLAQQSPLPGVSGATVPISPVNVPDVFQLHHSQMVQQQLLLSLSHCYHLLYLQHLEMQRLRQTLQNALPGDRIAFPDPPYPLPPMRTLGNAYDSSECQSHQAAPQYHLDNPSMARLSLSSTSSHPSHPPPHHSHQPISHDAGTQGVTTETLNNQVPPGNRANNYWDNFRSYSRQNLLSSTTHPNKSNDCPGGHCQGLPQRLTASAPVQNVKQLSHGGGYSHLLQSHEEGQHGESSTGPTDGFSYPVRAAENNSRFPPAGSRGLTEVGGVLQNASKDKLNKDLGSLASTPNVLKNRGNLSPNTILPSSQSLPSRSLQTGTLTKVPVKTGWNKSNTSSRERSATNDKTVPQPVEESVYGEVSKLVSQFDSNPQYLIRLLKELRKLNSEKAARNALRALHDASVSTFSRNSVDPVNNSVSNRAAHPPFSTSAGGPGGVRPRQPSREGSSSSDENEMLPQNTRTKKTGRHFQYATSRNSYDVGNPSLGSFGNEASPDSNVVLMSYGGVGDQYSTCTNSRQPSKGLKYFCRIGDCEEALLAELSEVLFSELAFLQLMQKMDGNSAQARSQKFHSIVQKFACQPHEFNNGSDMCAGTGGEDATAGEDASTEMKLPANLLASSSLCTGSHAEATDADFLMVMARRGDDEDNDKAHEDFSCDIPDACVGRGATVGVSPSLACEETFRSSPLHINAAHLDSHSLSPLPLPDLGALAAAAEGQGEVHYFDREVEMEGEGLGDTQDLAEADQSQGYMEAESALDDVQEGENFQVWGIDHALMNGGVDCTEDDQHNEDDPLGAAGGPNFAAIEMVDAERVGPELGLDEVPIKLRDGTGSGNATRDRGKEDGNKQEHPEHGDGKGRRSGGGHHSN